MNMTAADALFAFRQHHLRPACHEPRLRASQPVALAMCHPDIWRRCAPPRHDLRGRRPATSKHGRDKAGVVVRRAAPSRCRRRSGRPAQRRLPRSPVQTASMFAEDTARRPPRNSDGPRKLLRRNPASPGHLQRAAARDFLPPRAKITQGCPGVEAAASPQNSGAAADRFPGPPQDTAAQNQSCAAPLPQGVRPRRSQSAGRCPRPTSSGM
jgi:hypothetical protein